MKCRTELRALFLYVDVCLSVMLDIHPYPFLLITGFVTRLTRRVSLVEQELLTISEHLSSPPVFSGVRVTRSLVLCVCFVDRCLSFYTFSFGHCMSVYLRYTDSDYSFGIFKLFLLFVRTFEILESSIGQPIHDGDNFKIFEAIF